MDWLTFFSNLIANLVWPITLLLILLILRKPLKELIPLLRRAKYKDLELEFGEQAREIREEVTRELPQVAEKASLPSSRETKIEALAKLSPRAAVLEAWRQIELTASNAALRFNYNLSTKNTTQVIKFLVKQNKINPILESLLYDLKSLRNKAAHASDFELSEDSVLEYIGSANIITEYLQDISEKSS